MSRDKLIIAGTALGFCALAALAFLFSSGLFSQNQKYIYINETSDHRFDESIRMSIFASYKRTGVQNAVVITDKDVTRANINQQASALFQKLKVGQITHGRGILYVYSPKNQALKIEVGYALEGVLPDILVHRLELAAKTFTYTDRYHDFWAELINTINIHIEGKPTLPYNDTNYSYLSGGAGKTSLTYDQERPRDLRVSQQRLDSDFSASESLNKSLKRYLQSLKEGLSTSALPLLAHESQIFRRQTPLTPYILMRNHKMITTAGVHQIVELKNIAFVFFNPKEPVLPLIFVRKKQKWFAQEPMSWGLFQRFEDSRRVFLKYPLQTNDPELLRYLKKNWSQPLYHLSTSIRLGSLTQKTNKDSLFDMYFKLYDIIGINKIMQNWQTDALTTEQIWQYLDVQQNMGQMTPFLRAYQRASQLYPDDPIIAKNLNFYKTVFPFNSHEWLLEH